MSSVAVAAEAPPPGPLKYQTWTLKVPIHCEGCKRKVKKVLHNIDGVFLTTIDSQQHKVVVMGDVDADMLVKKLIKSGKQAEVWPESIENGVTLNHKQEQKDSNGSVNEGGETSEADETGSEVKTIISAGGATDTGGGEPNGVKKKKKKKKKKNKGNADPGALAPAASMLSPESAAPALGVMDLVGQPSEDFRTYQVIDNFPHENRTSSSYVYANPGSSYTYEPPVNAYAYSGFPTMHHLRPPQSEPIRNYEDDYAHDYDDDYNVGCSVM